jgi:uncharacterized protein (DUF2345 family)
MRNKTLEYAKKNIDIIAEENGIRAFISQGELYIQVKSGRNFKLSEDEIKYQATEYLNSEIEDVKHC